MLDNNTVTKLHELKLSTMAASFAEQLQSNGMVSLSFEERFGLLADAEWLARKNNRLKCLIRNADYALPGACVEDIEYHADRHLDRAMIARLATCNYVQECHNLILLGATGSGKTYLATAFGMAASRSFYTVKYVRLPELLGELAIARGEGNYRKVVKAYEQVSCLFWTNGCCIHRKKARPAICWKSWRDATKRHPPSSAPSSRWAAGIPKSESQP